MDETDIVGIESPISIELGKETKVLSAQAPSQGLYEASIRAALRFPGGCEYMFYLIAKTNSSDEVNRTEYYCAGTSGCTSVRGELMFFYWQESFYKHFDEVDPGRKIDLFIELLPIGEPNAGQFDPGDDIVARLESLVSYGPNGDDAISSKYRQCPYIEQMRFELKHPYK